MRVHVLRSTWHYVTAEDLVWLVEVTAPGARRPAVQQLAAAYTDAEVDRLSALVLDGLAGRHLTRPQVSALLSEAGEEVPGFQLMVLMAALELQALVCSGPVVDGAHSYALVADRVPAPRRLDRDEALAELALRYATGHGPVTVEDLVYWASLSITDARAGLAAAGDRLTTFEHDGRTYWHPPDQEPPAGPAQPAAHLLQILDETYRGYATASRWVLDAAGAVPRTREAAIGMALVDGQLRGRDEAHGDGQAGDLRAPAVRLVGRLRAAAGPGRQPRGTARSSDWSRSSRWPDRVRSRGACPLPASRRRRTAPRCRGSRCRPPGTRAACWPDRRR